MKHNMDAEKLTEAQTKALRETRARGGSFTWFPKGSRAAAYEGHNPPAVRAVTLDRLYDLGLLELQSEAHQYRRSYRISSRGQIALSKCASPHISSETGV